MKQDDAVKAKSRAFLWGVGFPNGTLVNITKTRTTRASVASLRSFSFAFSLAALLSADACQPDEMGR